MTPPTGDARDRPDPAADDAEDLRLVERIRKGEDWPFDVLYDRYVDRIYGYLDSLLGPHDAEDVLQQVFLHVVEALPREPRPHTSFRSWLYKVAHNAAVDHQRSRGPWQAIDPDELAQQMENLPDPFAHQRREGFDYLSDVLLLAALRRLSVMSREIIVLRYVADFSWAEIAELTDASVGAVRQAHYVAMEALRAELPPDGSGGQPLPRPLAMDRLPRDVSRSITHSFTLLPAQRRPAS